MKKEEDGSVYNYDRTADVPLMVLSFFSCNLCLPLHFSVAFTIPLLKCAVGCSVLAGIVSKLG